MVHEILSTFHIHIFTYLLNIKIQVFVLTLQFLLLEFINRCKVTLSHFELLLDLKVYHRPIHGLRVIVTHVRFEGFETIFFGLMCSLHNDLLRWCFLLITTVLFFITFWFVIWDFGFEMLDNLHIIVTFFHSTFIKFVFLGLVHWWFLLVLWRLILIYFILWGNLFEAVTPELW